MRAEVLRALEVLRNASREVATVAAAGSQDAGCNSPSMRALLELETGSHDLFSGDPHLCTLSDLLGRLKSVVSSLRSSTGKGGSGGIIGSLLRRRPSSQNQVLSRIAGSISDEIQSWIDREKVDRLIAALRGGGGNGDNEKISLLLYLEDRVGQGFDLKLQNVLLRVGVFAAIESVLANQDASKAVRDRCAVAVLALVRFNKAVFVGPVLMGPTVGALVASASPEALRSLNGLVAAIRSPLVDELLARGELPALTALLSHPQHEVKTLALEFALAIGYYGRKEAVEAMLAEGLIKRLLLLQRSNFGGALIDIDGWDETTGVQAGGVGKGKRRSCKQRRFLEARPFASAVARFAIQVEVGEGLRETEKWAAKQAIMKDVREMAISSAEEATVLAEVLWGATP